ncbi:hypothetical protein MRX96_001992 [Rhipicephalus microplus]|uniref:Putative conserved plasma membrane protein ovary overexpressed n=2 Tax=Rhipicephalus microplus TaxID=6941 RepID=A0A6M2D5U2_RHIMP|nr:uncharacterized protein LOC119177064 isoform X2 [Rhipicephalus microplus]
MSLVVGDLDNDGEGERILIEPYQSSSLLNSETALLFVSVAILAAVTACCWCGFYAASKRKQLYACFHQLHAPTEGPDSTRGAVQAPRPSSAHSQAYAHYLQPHLNAGAAPALPPPQLHTSLEMPSHAPGFKHIHDAYAS